ncbi:NAD-dependent epimerase/dehydratase family protein [Neorhizobium galegae]|uniref:NAD-dependent epimerase/dehydratase family protein n=1 Tax=Neorhizobium galegae TaxID=399 RepID=UPI00062825E4|nr:NAD-dependent epimerase/dehydratase family protein [Neorhizobium galegae]KAB1122595.1 NAD-dependent epimerase/dehydratase family protein [Neorhizobium galegae]MCQ1573780.1 NAD-dependent epimerase/dehydratase family protein [Neorhizobium galegae]MCQ1805644.1 NAD-dependent epimerase/dehydratase family protein [Neorhizobium galegae]MCQ1834754.1 NAD-dependent epimerase/dehydratase family protein [Neorhizobium galegae]UIY29760.1 NAD-dependent epimerase/dehydratase family protein [Neorhizobium ga
MRYFITGTAGFIGFHLARRLLEDGHEVLGFDGMTPYYSLRLKEARNAGLAQFPAFRPVIGMLEDKSLLDKSVEDFKPDVMIHLAAQAGVRYSLENPKAYLDSNLIGSWNILEIARNYGVGHLMLASTSSVYGANPDIPFRESDRADEPLTFYAATKKASELMAHSYAHLYKVPITAFRFFTVYGPWGRPDMALFKFVKAMIEDREIEIYGEGKMSRDFTYIDDLVNSIIDLSKVYPGEDNRVADIDTLSHQAPFRVVNIGGGQPSGLLDFVETIERIMGKPAKRKMLPMQKGDVPRTFASPDLLVALTGRKPEIGLEEGVKAFVQWYLDHRHEID